MVPGLVSTIIPVYNRPQMLEEAVQSVLDQTYRPVEVIIIDDGSTDNTNEVVDRLAIEYPGMVVGIHQQNTGPGLAREAGRQIARGEFIQYLDSDDILLPRKYELQVDTLKNHPECAVCYGKTRYRYRDGSIEQLPWKGSGVKVETMFPSFLVSRWWDTPTPLYRRSVCDEAGPWTDLTLEEDWEYDCRIASLGTRLCYCDEFIAEVRDHSQQRSCKGDALDTARLKERARSHALIFGHARKAGITDAFPEMQHFARELFLLSRQSGAAGLTRESSDLFQLARVASGNLRGRGWDFTLYRLFVALFGWSFTGRISCLSDKLRT